MLNLPQLSPLYVPLNLGSAPNLDTKNTESLKLQMYDIINMQQEAFLYSVKIY